MSAPFVAMDPRDWSALSEVLPKPWPLAAVRMDLRWHQDQVLLGALPMLSARKAAERWGWSKSSADRILRRHDEWGDPRKAQAWDAYLLGHLRDSAGTVLGHSEKEQAEKSADAGTPSGQSWDTSGHTRGSDTEHNHKPQDQEPSELSGGDPPTTETGDQDQPQVGQVVQLVPQPDVVAEVWEELMEVRAEMIASQGLPRRPKLALDDNRRRALRAAIKRLRPLGYTREHLKAAVRWCYLSDDIAAKGARTANGGNPFVALLRPDHTLTYVESAIAWAEANDPRQAKPWEEPHEGERYRTDSPEATERYLRLDGVLVDGAWQRITEAGGSWAHLRAWLAARTTDPDRVLTQVQAHRRAAK